MADTIVNTPGTRDDTGSNTLGMVAALLIILALIIGGVLFFRSAGGVGIPNTGTDINVTVPNPTDGAGGVDGGTGGITQ